MKKKYNQRAHHTVSWLKPVAICLILMLGFGTNLKAQLMMTKSNFTGTYTPISVGTGATASTAAGDDGTQGSVPIGFTFNYLGNNYTSVAICTNGWISFNSTTTSGSFGNNDMYTTSGPNNALFAWLDDLTTGVNSVTGTAPSILYQTQGTAGSQTFTVQWTNFCAYRTGGGSSINFQIVLYEGTNVIEFRYGNKVQGTVLTGQSASIGIENSTGGPGNYLDANTGSSRCGHFYLAENQWPTTYFRFTPGAPTPLAAGTYNVGAGQTYTSLSEAVADVNQRGVAGAVILNLTDALYDTSAAGGNNMFPILFAPIAGTSAANTVTVVKAGAPATIRWGGNIGGSTNGEMVNGTTTTFNTSNVEPIIGLVGADYVNLNNIEVRGDIGYRNADHAIGVYNNTATDGSTFNTIENFSVVMNRANTGTRGVLFSVPVTPSAATGANSNNTLRNFSITNVFAGIQLTGNATNPDINNSIGNSVCANFNTIGNPAQANDIGNTTSATYGIRATNQSGISIYNNSIRNVTASAAQVDGIFLEGFLGTSSVYNNRIRTLRNSSTSSTTAVSGIRASHNTTGANVARIYNNSVSEILSAYTGSASGTRILKGIFISGTGGGTTQSYQIHNNAVSIDGSASPTISSVCFEIATTSGPVYNLSNNIFANFTAAQTGAARHFALFSTSAAIFGPAGTTSNNNDLFIANDLGTSGYTGLGNTTTYATIANWNTAMTGPGGLETASIATNPNFVSNTADLHVTNLALNNAGQALQAYVTTDLACAARTDNDPGVYNIEACVGTPTAGTISGSATVCSGLGTTLNLNGASIDAGVTYQWASSTTMGGPYSTMLGTSSTQATGAMSATTYYQVTVTCTSSGMSAATPEFTLTVNTTPTLTVTPNSAQFCTPGGTPVALTASGANTYTWTPATGLSGTSGASVNASPTANTTYSVTGTSVDGCVSAAATATITVASSPTTLTVTAVPSSVCSGANSQLNAASNPVYNNTINQYTFAATTGTFTPLVGATAIPGAIGDDFMVGNLPIGFTFPYGATTFTVLAVSSNGNIQLGQTTTATSGAVTLFTNNLTANANVLGSLWDDNNTSGGTVSYLLQGTAPNQTLTIEYLNMHVGGTGSGSNPTISLQVVIHQNGTIQYIYGGTSGALATTTASIGISGTVGNYLSVNPATSTASSSTETSVTSATNFPSGTIYTFTPPVPPALTYTWSPATFLSATNIANPMATAITATTTYTATATSPAGCSVTNTITIAAGSPLTSAASVSPNDTVCANSNVTLNATPTGGGAPYTFAWAGPNSFASTSQNPVITGVTTAATGTYTVTVTDNCGANSMATVSLTVNALPTVAVNPTSGAICLPGGSAIALTASGASTYSWSPSTGLSATTGASVNANPSSSQIYTVSGTDANGCVAVATSTINVGNNPVISSVTATPSNVCSGANSQLNVTANIPFNNGAAGYSFSASSGTFTPLVGATNLPGAIGDDFMVGNHPIGFNFSFGGTVFTVIGISSNGNIQLGQTTTATSGTITLYTNALATNANILAPFQDDNNTSGGTVSYLLQGTSPNQTLTIQYLGMHTGGVGSASNPTINLQVIIHENGTIQYVYGSTSGALSGTTASIGISSAVGNYLSVTPAMPVGSSTVSSTVENTGINSATNLPSGTIYTFTPPTPPTITYSWMPTTFLSDPSISNPMATGITASTNYTVSVFSSTGCTVIDSVAIIAGTPLTSAANATPNDTVCVGTNTTLHAVPTGGGGPYTYAWTGPNGFTSVAQDTLLNAITLTQAGTYSVTITDNCGANSMATVSVTVNANPVVSVDIPAASICLPGGSAVSVTASGAVTYAWTPAAGLSGTTGASVTANPGVTTVYTVTGTDANGCIGTAASTISVGANPTFNAITATPSTVCPGGSSQLLASASVSAPVSISEVTMFRTGTGASSYPAAITGADLVELSNNLSVPVDISGFVLSAYGNNSATSSHTITFPASTTIPVGGVVVVNLGTGTNNPGAGYYNTTTGGNDTYSSNSQVGIVLYNGTTVVDAVGLGGSATGSYTFNAATNVTAADFTGFAPNLSGNAGVIRNVAIDSNTGADWVIASGAQPQTIGTFNMVYSAPGTMTYSWLPAAGLDDDSIANPLASGIATTTVYSVTATSAIGCSNNTGTVTVTVSSLSAVNIAAAPSTPICAGASVVLSSTPVGGGPYTYSWMPGGATTATNTVTPSSTTVYTLTVMNSCGENVTNTVTVNVNPLPVVTAGASGALYCNPGTAVMLTGSGAATYSWTPSAGLDVTNTATPNATPTVTTTYTVTGTDGNGCVNTATVAVTSAPTPTVTAMATPSTPVCAGTPVQLGSTAIIPTTYIESVVPFSPEVCAANAGPTGDDATQGPNAIGFSFTYYGVTYTDFAISTNGNIQLGNGSGNATNPTYSNAWTDQAIPNTAVPNNMVALAWDDWSIAAGEIKWGVTGTAPNRKLVVCYATTGRGGGSADTLQGQIVLEETTNNVILNTIKKGIQPSNTATQGIEDATGSNASMAVSGRNNQAWNVNNETRIFTPYLGTYTYSWSPAGDLDTATIPTPIARLLVSTTFTITATEASGCSSNATVAVTVNPLPVVALGVDTAICAAGSPITLDAGNAGSTYTWNTAETTQSISVDTTGSYDVSVTDANGCVGVDTISVTVNASPVVGLGVDTVRCGGSVTLDAGNAGSTYAWSDATSGQTTTISSTGIYDVVVTTPQGCEGFDTVMVTINAIPAVNIGNDTLFCGSNLTLDAGNAGSSYFWNTTDATQTINVTTSGQYFVEVTTPQNCSSRDTINVTIAPAITVSLGNDSAVCSSTSVILDAQNAGSTYLWSDNTTSSTLIVMTPGVYSVVVTSVDGCTAQDTVVFTDNSPAVDLTLPFSITCVTTSVNALSGGSPVGGFYSGTAVTGTNFNAATAGVGTYLITYTYTDGTTGCFASDTQSVMVDPCVGIKQLSTAASIVIAPNPTTGYFSINMPLRDNVLKAEMYTVEGQLISSETYKGREVYEVNITELANAVYYMRLTVDGETNVVKIVKQQ